MPSPALAIPSANITRGHARVLLAAFLLTAAFFVGVTLSPLQSGFADAPSRGPSDIALFEAVAERTQAGEPYYDAMGDELTTRGYPTASVFNWRTPLSMWLVAVVPDPAMANVLAGGLALALVLLAFQLLADEGSVNQGIVGVLLLAGALLPCFLGELVLLPELWSGILVALSAVCFGLRRPRAGVVSGTAALFFRELAAPYCIVCLALAARERRYRELAWWGVGLVAYATFYALHLAQVLPQIGHEARPTVGWVRFGGAGFLISTAQMNAFLLLLPQWVTAVYLACALLGAATWNTPAGRRIGWTLAAYVLAFGVAGNDFNQYWGSQISPLVCLPAARSWWVLREMWRASALKRFAKGRGEAAA